MRSCPETFDLELPRVGVRPQLVVTCLRPAHPCDDLCVKVCADTLEHIIAFIRAHGFSLDALTSKRAYHATDEPGLWRNGSAGLVRKLEALPYDAGGNGREDGCRKAKYRSCNRNCAVPLADETDEAAGGGTLSDA